MTAPHDDNKLENWKGQVAQSLFADRAPWDTYDAQITVVVNTYNAFLQKTPGYVMLNLQLIKALSWVETGAWIPEWKTRPMQVENIGDPGLHQILETDSGKLLLPPVYKTTLTKANVVADGNRNIEAGVGYFLWVFAHFGYVAPPPPPPALAPPACPNVQSSPAEVHHRTHAKVAPVKKIYAVTGWKPITLEYVAAHYNGGDGNYLGKLQYCLDVVSGRVVPTAPEPPEKSAAPRHEHQ